MKEETSVKISRCGDIPEDAEQVGKILQDNSSYYFSFSSCLSSSPPTSLEGEPSVIKSEVEES